MLKLEKVQLESDMQNLQSDILFIMKQGVDVCLVNVNIKGCHRHSESTSWCCIIFIVSDIILTDTR
jgi:hypothetical protein